MQRSFSFWQQTRKRLIKNKAAVFGLVIIGIAVIVAIFGYLIAPDNSPNADSQAVEIQAKKTVVCILFFIRKIMKVIV